MKCAITFFSLLVLLVVVASAALAQSSGGYDLTWSTLDNGGGTSAGGGYSLTGTIGQPDAGVKMTGGGFILAGGFWSGTNSNSRYSTFLPVILR